MSNIHGDSETRSQNGAVESQIHLHAGGGGNGHAEFDERASGARRRLDEITERATGLASRIRDTARERLDRANIDAPAGIIDFVRRRPLTSLGAVFAAGFIAGFAGSPEHHHWAVERARRRIRRLILGGLAAAIAHELRSVIGEGPLGQLIEAFDSSDWDDEDYDPLDLADLEEGLDPFDDEV